jgi:alpha-beta hydrolase superfamily lysophospholipase
MPIESFQFRSRADDWPIQCYRWPIDGPPTATVAIAHGMAEHARRYDRFAAELNRSGYAVVAMDHRAHGRTLGPQGFGDFGAAGWDGLVADIGQLIDALRSESPHTPIVLFGHSMGASAAQQYSPDGSAKLAALILSGTTLRKPGETVPVYNDAFEPSRTRYDWLSRDPDEVDKYVADPLCGFEGQTVRNGFDRNDPRRDDPGRLARIRNDLPVLIVVGHADPVHRNLDGVRYLETRWREAGVRRIDKLIYPGGRHEMLNELNRNDVMRDITEWLDQILAAARTQSWDTP